MSPRTRACASAALGVLALVGMGCTHSVHQVAVAGLDDVRALRGARPVEADGEQFVILGFVTDTDFADEAYANLLSQCPDGALQAVEARHSTSHGFMSYTNHLKMRALCVQTP